MKLTNHDWYTTLTGSTADGTKRIDLVGVGKSPTFGVRFDGGRWHWYNLRYNANYAYKFNRTCISSSQTPRGFLEQLSLIWGSNVSGLYDLLSNLLHYKECACPFVKDYDFESDFCLERN